MVAGAPVNHTTKKINNLIVTVDDLINHPSLLKLTNFLFIADTPVSREFYQLVKQAADAEGAQIVLPVILDTFEEEIHRQLTEI
jgi:hypothetical protein